MCICDILSMSAKILKSIVIMFNCLCMQKQDKITSFKINSNKKEIIQEKCKPGSFYVKLVKKEDALDELVKKEDALALDEFVSDSDSEQEQMAREICVRNLGNSSVGSSASSDGFECKILDKEEESEIYTDSPGSEKETSDSSAKTDPEEIEINSLEKIGQ